MMSSSGFRSSRYFRGIAALFTVMKAGVFGRLGGLGVNTYGGTTTTFKEQYEALEDEFIEQVRKDNEGLEEDALNRSVFLPNLAPQGPVDFVLVAMEPSTGGGAGEIQQGDAFSPKNFTGSVEDFILHFCAREYLCAGGKSYYLTDLSKGAMRTREARDQRQERYQEWYPLLKDELRLVARPEAPVIAIGNDPHAFLIRRDIEPRLKGPILHYSQQAAGARERIPSTHRDRYSNFAMEVSWGDIEETVRQVMGASELQDYIEGTLDRLSRGQKLTESRKKLMFTYKVQFEGIRKEVGI